MSNTNFPLTNISPIDGRYENKTSPLKLIFSEYGLMRYRLKAEIFWLESLSDCDDIAEVKKFTPDQKNKLHSIYQNFNIDNGIEIKNIESKTNHDVKAIEYFIKDKLDLIPELKNIKEFVHFACTSEDINNLAYGLMLVDGREVLNNKINNIINFFENFINQYADLSILSRTHGQPASPSTLGKEFSNVLARLKRQLFLINNTPIMGKANGAVGNYNAHLTSYPNVNWPNFSKQFVEKLGLTWNPHTTQIEPHDGIAELLNNIARLNTILIDFCNDTWHYISINYFSQKAVKGEVGSSTMPHKINPIDFENAEGNLSIANAVMDFLSRRLPQSRWQRDLIDSTLLRNLGVGFAHSLIAYESLSKGLNKLDTNKESINQDLENHWEILAEPIQMVMRRHGIESPYEKLKEFSRGKKIDKIQINNFIDSLELDNKIKITLKNLTPGNYIGLAEQIANEKI